MILQLTHARVDLSSAPIAIDLIEHDDATSLLAFTTPEENFIELRLANDQLEMLYAALAASLPKTAITAALAP